MSETKINMVMRPYTEIQFREFSECELDSFMIIATAANAPILHYNGVAMIIDIDETDFGIALRGKDILMLNYVLYCFVDYEPVVRTKTNIEIELVHYEGYLMKVLADTAHQVREKEKKKSG